jgi:tetratricopeptide (TPR) repeat protein
MITVDALFRQASKQEEARDFEGAAATYRHLLAIDTEHTSAHVNLGTLCYNKRDYAAAQYHYQRALDTSPRYALAHFDMANVMDEIRDYARAEQHYKLAIEIAPTYGDAHYNLALLYEKINQPRKALICWRKYKQLDSQSPWHDHATRRIKNILDAESLKLVAFNPNPKRTKRRAKLHVL